MDTKNNFENKIRNCIQEKDKTTQKERSVHLQRMIVWGISALFHDAGVSVIKDGKLVFGAHAERYSGIKHDEKLNYGLLKEAIIHGHPESCGVVRKSVEEKSKTTSFNGSVVWQMVSKSKKVFARVWHTLSNYMD